MSSPDEKIEIEVKDPVVAPDPLSVDAAREGGLSEQDIELGKKHGLLKDEKSEDTKSDADSGDKQDKKEESKDEEEKGQQKAALLADEEKSDADETKDFSPNERALFFQRKRERLKRQTAERQLKEREDALKARDSEIEALKKRIAALESKPAPKPKSSDPLDILGDEQQPESDEKPLTLKDLEAREAEKEAKRREAENAQRAKAESLASAYEVMEADGRSKYSDFEKALELANDVMQNIRTLDKLYPDEKQRTRVIHRARELVSALQDADKMIDAEWNAADMAYELGTLHPQYGKTPHVAGTSDDRDENPESEPKQLVPRRSSSASLNGGGSRRTLRAEELKLENVRDIPGSKWSSLPKSAREKLLRA